MMTAAEELEEEDVRMRAEANDEEEEEEESEDDEEGGKKERRFVPSAEDSLRLSVLHSEMFRAPPCRSSPPAAAGKISLLLLLSLYIIVHVYCYRCVRVVIVHVYCYRCIVLSLYMYIVIVVYMQLQPLY